MLPKYLCTMVPDYLGIMVPKCLGTMVPDYLGIMAPRTSRYYVT